MWSGKVKLTWAPGDAISRLELVSGKHPDSKSGVPKQLERLADFKLKPEKNNYWITNRWQKYFPINTTYILKGVKKEKLDYYTAGIWVKSFSHVRTN
jgi:hypothetical protein